MVKISGWKSKTLGTLIDEGKIVIQTGPFGTVLSAKEFVKYGIPVVAVREIREGYIQIFDETPCVSMETYNRLSKYNLATNDLVFARKGNANPGYVLDDFPHYPFPLNHSQSYLHL